MSTQLIDSRAHTLRLIAPTSQRASEGASVTLLGQTYGFTELPISGIPSSADLVEGTYTGRLGDSGEWSASFPNVAGSKGLWRSFFDPDLALQFLEIYRDKILEFVGAVQRLEVDRGKVTVSGFDAWTLLRKAYERDRSWTAAPGEVIGAYTRVPVALVADDFPGAALDPGTWTLGFAASQSVSGGIATITSGVGGTASVLDNALGLTGDTWRVTVVFRSIALSAGSLPTYEIAVTDGAATTVFGDLFYGFAPNRYELQSAAGGVSHSVSKALDLLPDQAGPVTMVLQRQGRWISGFINGTRVGVLPCPTGTQSRLLINGSKGGSGGTGITMRIDQVVVLEDQQLLQRVPNLGDFVLPGSYPTGGLRGRYYDNADLQGLAAAKRAQRVMSPDRDSYGERLDPVLATGSGLALPLQPGNGGSYFSVRWFGAVYLRLDLGNYVFETNQADGARVWVGKTAWGDQLIDDWVVGAGRLTTGTLTASSLGAKAGWYPIIVEHQHDTTAYGFILSFTPPGTGYTDPGGTAITASTKIAVPASSLSPLGCYDNRLQGASHFDTTQGAAQQFGYQMWCQPMQLESGEFPGRLVPLLRVGRDTDIEMMVDQDDRSEPLFSPGVTLDSSDQVISLVATGSGLADGTGSQVAGEVQDLASLSAGLFALQGWIDAGDIGFRELLAARAGAELALRESPWEEVRGTPRGQERLSDTWPLSSSLAAMRWRPGDGVRLKLPDIGVEDDVPRQMLQVTRTFGSLGRTGTQVAFRQRPRSAARSLRSLARAAIAPQRSYQGRVASVPSKFIDEVVAAGGFSSFAIVALGGGEPIVRAVLKIVLNSAAQSLDVEINGTLRGAALGGPWVGVPVSIDVQSYAVAFSPTDPRFYFRIKNLGASPTTVDAVVLVDVLR